MTLTLPNHGNLGPIILIHLALFATAFGQNTTFSYQGRLTDNMSAASGTYQMSFSLYDASTNGNQIGSAIENTAVSVNNGIFTVQLDFGAAAFPGAERFLEISVRRNSNESYVTLTPRQRITSAPYAIRALSAASADNATSLGGTAANQYVVTTDSRLSDARAPLAGSGNYIQNGTSTQASANFNISGDGTAGGTLSANIVNAATQYNLGGSRVLASPGSSNLFVGPGTGANNSSSGVNNTFIGFNAGIGNTSGQLNSFLGSFAGGNNTTGIDNSFFGYEAGFANLTGVGNSFFGVLSGLSNTTGARNTLFGYNTNVGGPNLTNASAFGSNAVVSQSNSVVLGNNANVGIGTSAPNAKLHVVGGNVYIAHPNSLIITSPNGSCFFITVSDTGALSTIATTCP